MKPTRPLLRYFGGKWQLRNWVTSHHPEHQFYAEPFAGAEAGDGETLYEKFSSSPGNLLSYNPDA